MERPRKLVPPIWLLLTLVAMGLLDHYWPLHEWLPRPWNWSGGILVACGIGVTVSGAMLFKRAGTAIVPFELSTALVTTGIYRYTRNPMYLGMMLLLLGVALMLGSCSAFLPIPFFWWVITKRFIEGEERFLTEIFGQSYLDYTQQVRRWL